MGSVIQSNLFRDALSLRLNGTTQYGHKDNPSWKGDVSGTLSLWIKPSATLTGTDASTGFLSLGVNDAGNNSNLSIRQRVFSSVHPTNNYISFVHRPTHGATPNQVIFTTTPLVIGAWNYVSVSSNGGAWSCRVNGVDQAITVIIGSNTGDWFGDVSGANHRFTLGNLWSANAAVIPWAGDLDEFNYFDLLNPAEDLVLYNSGTPLNPYRLALAAGRWKTWLRCGDSRDTAATMFDEIGSDNATLVGSPTYVSP
jgi:hypothetical protein